MKVYKTLLFPRMKSMMMFTSNEKSNKTFSNIFTNNYACLDSHSNSYLLPAAIDFVNFEL